MSRPDPLSLVRPVPRLYPGGTVGVVATGPSLTREDCAYLRERVDGVIAVNRAYEFIPEADILYGTDGLKFWEWYPEARAFPGLKWALTPTNYDIPLLRYTGDEGLDLDPDALRSGQNSAYAAINLAVHLGAARVVLLGVDLRPGVDRAHDHCHPPHPNRSVVNYLTAMQCFTTIISPLEALRVEVVNCSPGSWLRVFPRRPLREVLS